MGPGVSNVAIGVCWRGRVRLGGHDPRKRREGRVGILADGQVPVLFVHADVGWGNERELKREGKGRGEGKLKRRLRGGCIKWASKEGGVANCSRKGR